MNKMLVHVCCTDCGLKLLSALEREFELGKEQVELYYYNPNIHPRSEYLSRLKAAQEVLGKEYKLIIPNWKPSEYYEQMRSLPEDVVWDKTVRCGKCWALRLGKVVEYAKNNGYEMVSSTLVSSQYQDRERIVRMGNALAKQAGIELVVPNQIECEMKTKGFYKQNYCGCAYSLVERMREKYLTTS